MRHAFRIYPALLIITPVMQEQTTQTNDLACWNEKPSNYVREAYFTSWPQTYWGDCVINESRTLLVLRFKNEMNAGPVEELLDGKLKVVEPAKLKGKRFTITYVPVLN